MIVADLLRDLLDFELADAPTSAPLSASFTAPPRPSASPFPGFAGLRCGPELHRSCTDFGVLVRPTFRTVVVLGR